MGSSGECRAKSIDASAGGLVWVRRRNGSWWPGQILGLEELPESSSVSARSGTPVKLLGLKDTCVDWHNLENSKRVKAFRCGEYDRCIEKAKLVAASAPKKVVKYNRREDAILHALEIESGCLGKDNPNFSLGIHKQNGAQNLIKESPTSSHPQEGSENVNGDFSSSEDNSSSQPELSHFGVSFEEANCISSSKEQDVQGQQKVSHGSEDDGTEGAKRMKDLDDLGMGVMQSVKRKRSQMVHVNECLKKKSRCRPLTKVLQSTAMVSIPIMCEELPSPTESALREAPDGKAAVINNISNGAYVLCENGTTFIASGHTCGKCEQKENEMSEILEFAESGSSKRLFDVPFVTVEKYFAGLSPIVSCASQKAQLGAGAQSSQSGQVETISHGNGEHNESVCTSSGNADILDSRHRMGKETSKWQSKGKRYFCHSSESKRLDSGYSMDMSNKSNACLAGMDRDTSALSSGQKVRCNLNGVPLTSEFSTYTKSRPVTKSQMDDFQGWSRNISHRESQMKGPTADLPIPQRSLPYRQSRFTVNPKYESSDFSLRHHISDSSLYDVKLEVKSCYQLQHVPYISIMSKLNGQPITGHLLAVEVLDDGFCNQLLVSAAECYSGCYDLDDDSALQGVYMVYKTKLSSGGRVPTKHVRLQACASPTKSLKSKKEGILSKKVRKLSSLTGFHKQNQEKKPTVQKLKGPAIPCVPLKVVFSRIKAALNSSIRPSHHLIAPGIS